jgi:hypothetical protein
MRTHSPARERSTLLVAEFPRRLRLAVKARAVAQDRPMREVFVELLETALALETGPTRRKEVTRT